MKNVIWSIKKFDELTITELYKILKARMEVFIIEQDCHYLDLDNYDQKALHLWAEKEGFVLAYCRVFDRDIKYNEASIGRVLTTESGRGKGVGRRLMNLAVEVIENRFQTSEIRISAQDYLLKFYSELGFQDTGKKYLEDNIPHTEMIKK